MKLVTSYVLNGMHSAAYKFKIGETNQQWKAHTL
jgi:hypothetical protein